MIAARLSAALARSRRAAVSASLLIVLAVGLADYATGWELSFSGFYLLALGIAAWFVGRRFAWFVSALSVGVSLAGDFATGQPDAGRLAPWWNASITMIFYAVVITLLARLRAAHDELERRVAERTAQLTGEIAERERLERELLEISEREQRRIGHDLHDSLGQHLTGLALAGQVLEEKLAARGVSESADAARLVSLAEEGIALTRRLAKGLHPIELEAGGLMAALQELAAASRGLLGVECAFECDSPVPVREPAVAAHLYRIAQEAVSNAARHGRARRVVIQLEPLEDGIALRVADDGAGMAGAPRNPAGMGLRIMAHRAEMIGARFATRPGEGGGTVVECRLRQEAGGEAAPA